MTPQDYLKWLEENLAKEHPGFSFKSSVEKDGLMFVAGNLFGGLTASATIHGSLEQFIANHPIGSLKPIQVADEIRKYVGLSDNSQVSFTC